MRDFHLYLVRRARQSCICGLQPKLRLMPVENIVFKVETAAMLQDVSYMDEIQKFRK
jgi:hypothetical protein